MKARRKIYVASSWKNRRFFDQVVRALRDAGHEVYSFKEAPSHFYWSELDPNWENWSSERFMEVMEDDRSLDAFDCDIKQLDDCDTCVLVTPAGRSGHLELGYAAGQGKDVYTILFPGFTPELMLLVGRLVESIEDLLLYLEEDVRS